MLADRAGINRTYLSQLENGKFDVTVAVLESICVGLEITLAQFFEGLKL